jgi:hypothetical protein
LSDTPATPDSTVRAKVALLQEARRAKVFSPIPAGTVWLVEGSAGAIAGISLFAFSDVHSFWKYPMIGLVVLFIGGVSRFVRQMSNKHQALLEWLQDHPVE